MPKHILLLYSMECLISAQSNSGRMYPMICLKYFNIWLFYRINLDYLGLEGEAYDLV